MAEDIKESKFEWSSTFQVLPLEEIALTRIAAIFCNNLQLIMLITKCKFYNDPDRILSTKNDIEFQNVEAKAYELISSIPLEYGIFKEKILKLLWPLTYRIIRWKFLHASTIKNEFLRHFYWTDRGRIDNIRTAQCMIANEMIPVLNRFALACNVSLHEEIVELWTKMKPEDITYLLADSSENISPLTKFYTHLNCNSIIRVEESFFQFAIKNVSIELLNYFFSLLPSEMKSVITTNCMNYFTEKIKNYPFLEEDVADRSYFLISNMCEEKRKNLDSCDKLACLLYIPRQDIPLEEWKNALRLASVTDVEIVLFMIFNKFHTEIFRDKDYCKIFCNTWNDISDSLKKSIKTETDLGVKCFCKIVNDDFKYILGENKWKKIVEFVTSKPAKNGKWSFLLFLVEKELVTTSTIVNKIYFVIFNFPNLSYIYVKRLVKTIDYRIEREKRRKKKNIKINVHVV